MSISRMQSKNGERFSDFVRAPGTHAAVTIFLADISAIAVYGQGLVLFALVAIGAATLAYLVARVHQPLAGRPRSIRRPRQTVGGSLESYRSSREPTVSPRAKAGY